VIWAALRLFLDKAESDMINLKGTNIEEGLKKALAMLDTPFKRNRVILLITDGEDHEGDAPKQAAAIYKQHKIQIHTIGIGTASGSRVPEDRDGGDTLDTYLFKKDKAGQYVTSRLNESGLKKIAAAGGGEYYFLSGSAFNSQALADRIRTMENRCSRTGGRCSLSSGIPFFWELGLCSFSFFS
jgi:Ca-activated chloride channel family protein